MRPPWRQLPHGSLPWLRTRWRASRLADLAAKMAARADAVPAELTAYLRTAGGLYLHQLSLLGLVTHLANHGHRQLAVGTLETLRDSAGKRPRGPRAAKRRALSQEEQEEGCGTPAPAAADATHPPPPPTPCTSEGLRKAARRTATLARNARVEVADARLVARHVAQN